MDAFYQSILASVLFYAVLSWGGGGSISAEDKNRINEMIKKAGSVIGLIPGTLEATVEMRARSKLKLILGYKNHPLHNVFKGLGSSFSERLAMPQCSTEQLRKFFIPAAVRNFNKHCWPQTCCIDLSAIYLLFIYLYQTCGI